jgi:hypothetical protein
MTRVPPLDAPVTLLHLTDPHFSADEGSRAAWLGLLDFVAASGEFGSGGPADRLW